MSNENYGSGVSTLKLEGITLKQQPDGFTFEISVDDLIPVLKTLKNKRGVVKGRISPLNRPTPEITHLAFGLLPVRNIEEQSNLSE